MSPTFEEFLKLIERANLAPSVHNTQPTRWRLEADGSVLVLEEIARRLTVADPAGRDAAVSLGSSVEGFSIACADSGSFVDVERVDGAVADGLRPVARLTLRDGTSPDVLSAFVDTRRSYRGAFAKNAARVDAEALLAEGDVTLARTPAEIERLAQLNDDGALRTYRDKAYRSELVSWLRLSRRDPRWALDGLNAEAMAMSPLVATGAGAIFAPRVFEALDGIGIGSTLVAEAPVVRSAQTIALFHRNADEDPFETGRRFYRLWLEFEQIGLSAAAMSVLADDEEIRATVAREFDIPGSRRLINAFRLGVAPKRIDGAKARLQRSSLVV